MVFPDVMEEGLVDADAKRGRWELWSLSGVPETVLIGVELLASDRRRKVVGVNEGKVFAGDAGSILTLDVDVQATDAVKPLTQIFVVLS